MEQDINTASVADIFVEQAQAEFDVALSLLDATIKDATFQEFYFVQEGELGTAVADARADVRADGKKHHLKAAIAAIKAFFKFFITKIGGFFHKSAVDGQATVNAANEIIKKVSAEVGEDLDIVLPYSKERFGKILSFYNNMDTNLGDVIDASGALVDYCIQNQGGEHGKLMKNRSEAFRKIENFIREAKAVAALSKPDNFDEKARRLFQAANSKIRSISKTDQDGNKYVPEDRKRTLKNAYKAGYFSAENKEYRLEGDTWVFVPKNMNTTYITHEDYAKFVSIINSAKSTWNNRKGEIQDNIKTLDQLITSTGVSDVATKASGSKYGPDQGARVDMAVAKNELKKLGDAVAAIIKPADDVLKVTGDAIRDARAKANRKRSEELRAKHNRMKPGESTDEFLARQEKYAGTKNIDNTRKYENEPEPIPFKQV